MRRWLLSLALTGACLALLIQGAEGQNAQPAKAKAIAKAKVQPKIQPQPLPAIAIAPPFFNQQRLAAADAAIVGRVVGLEPMDVEATPAPNQAKTNYRIAVVQVNEVVYGLKSDAKMVRVGWIAPAVNNVPPNGGPGVQIQIQPAIQPAIQPLPGRIVRPGFPGIANVTLQVGQDGLFTLTKHHKENFYTVANYNHFISSQNNANFENEVKNAKQLGKVIGDLQGSLKSNDREQRYLAAAVLINKYRINTTGQPTKQEPIDAAESKLILKALSEGDFTPNRINSTIPGAMELFNQLGITANDGYALNNVRTQQDIAQAMQKWLSENADKYRIKKLVIDPNARVIEPQPQPLPPVRPPIRPLPIKKGVPGAQPLPVQPPQVDPAPQILPVQPIQGIPAPAPAVPAQPLPIRR